MVWPIHFGLDFYPVHPRLGCVNAANYRVRRATLDDLPQLLVLWKIENLPAAQLEKRLTEFQVADDGAGTILAAWGVQLAPQQIKIHSESLLRSDEADALRERFWERLQNIIHNHAVVRLWTRESNPYWHGCGFHAPTAEQLKKLPPIFTNDTPPSLVLELRPEPEQGQVDIEKEFEIFREQERARTEATVAKGKKMSLIATLLATLLFVGVLVGGVFLLKPDLARRLFKTTAAKPGKAQTGTNAPSTNSAPAGNPAPTNAPAGETPTNAAPAPAANQ